MTTLKDIGLKCQKKEREFEKLTHEMLDTFIKKNADYGDSTTNTFTEFGLTSSNSAQGNPEVFSFVEELSHDSLFC